MNLTIDQLARNQRRVDSNIFSRGTGDSAPASGSVGIDGFYFPPDQVSARGIFGSGNRTQANFIRFANRG